MLRGFEVLVYARTNFGVLDTTDLCSG